MKRNQKTDVMTVYRLCTAIISDIETNLDKYLEIGVADELRRLLYELDEAIKLY